MHGLDKSRARVCDFLVLQGANIAPYTLYGGSIIAAPVPPRPPASKPHHNLGYGPRSCCTPDDWGSTRESAPNRTASSNDISRTMLTSSRSISTTAQQAACITFSDPAKASSPGYVTRQSSPISATRDPPHSGLLPDASPPALRNPFKVVPPISVRAAYTDDACVYDRPFPPSPRVTRPPQSKPLSGSGVVDPIFHAGCRRRSTYKRLEPWTPMKNTHAHKTPQGAHRRTAVGILGAPSLPMTGSAQLGSHGPFINASTCPEHRSQELQAGTATNPPRVLPVCFLSPSCPPESPCSVRRISATLLVENLSRRRARITCIDHASCSS